MLACKCALVSEPISQNTYVRPGEHFLEASGPDAIYRACAHLLNNPEIASELARNGHERVTETLSARHWWPEFFREVRSGAFVPAAFDRAKFDLTPFLAQPKSSPGESNPSIRHGFLRPKWARLPGWLRN
jgi:hypothetical protein